MNEKRLTSVSKFLSLVLRHQPALAGITLEDGGWVRIDALLSGCSRAGHSISHDELLYVVENNNKRRFALDASGERIRANQGHSVRVDLHLEPRTPPTVLYHGAPASIEAQLRREGLKRMKRHHVHLSPDEDTARSVGARRGKPVILRIAAGEMHAAGHTFYCSENGVWLTDEVPPQYLS